MLAGNNVIRCWKWSLNGERDRETDREQISQRNVKLWLSHVLFQP